jgi:hypothetical protein
MSFDWLKDFQQNREKTDDYAEKTLAAYKLGMRANGSIAGVRIAADPSGCLACKRLDPTTIFHPDDAPHLPLSDCDNARSCNCVYRPVMTYQVDD